MLNTTTSHGLPSSSIRNDLSTPSSTAPSRRAVATAKAGDRLDKRARFATVTLVAPAKEDLAGFRPGDTVTRRVRLIIVPGEDSTVVEAVVDVVLDRDGKDPLLDEGRQIRARLG